MRLWEMTFEVVSRLNFSFHEHSEIAHLFYDRCHLIFKHETAVIEFLRLRFRELVFGMNSQRSDAERAAATYFYPTGQTLTTEDVLATSDNFWVIWSRHANGTVHGKGIKIFIFKFFY
jgi:hypothetical protein